MSRSKSPNKRKSKRLPNPSHGPPPEDRYCYFCDRVTKWKYNRVIGHGQCTDCGSTSLYSGRDKEDVLQKLELYKKGFNFLGCGKDW